MAAEDNARDGLSRSVVGNPVFLLTLLGLILYGILRLADGIFYERLGAKPEEVGLGYAETLSQAAIGIVIVLAMGFVAFGVLFLLAFCVFPSIIRWEPLPAEPVTRREKIVVGVGFGLAVVGVVIAYLTGHSHLFWTVVGAIFVAIGAVGAVREIWREVRTGESRRLRWGIGAAVAASAFGTVGLVLWQASIDSRGVRLGEVRHPTVFGPIPFGSWGADAVWVQWVAADPPQGFARGRRRCLLYLGRASGTAVFLRRDWRGRADDSAAGDLRRRHDQELPPRGRAGL